MSKNPSPTDPWLDARLRNVPLPVDLLRRLEQVANPEINRMDRALANVPLPEGFLERLTEISRIERPSRARDLVERRPAAVFALAASLLLMLGGGYLAFSRGGAAPGVGAGNGNLAKDGAPLLPPDELAHDKKVDGTEVADSIEFADGRGEMGADDRDPTDPMNELDDRNLPSDIDLRLVDHAWDSDRWESGHPRVGKWPPELEVPPQPMPELPAPGGGNRVAASKQDRPALGDDDVYGTNDRFKALPDLPAVSIETPRGMAPPIVAGYDLRFLQINGLHPFVQPGANPLLRSVQLPLVTSTAPWRRIVRSVAEGRLPAPADLRTEDFLAALDYHFPPAPPAGLAVETAVGPAPLVDNGLSLLQVAVHAGELAKEQRAATHLTLVVDNSQAMRRSERWSALGDALGKLVENMQADDRLTLVVFSEGPETVIDSQSAEELLRDGSGKLLRAIEAVESRPAAKMAAGVQLACRLVSRGAAAAQEGAGAAHDDAGAAPAEDAAGSAPAAGGVGAVSAPATGAASAPAAGGAGAPARRMLILSSGRVDSGVKDSQRAQASLAELVAAGLDVKIVDMSRAERAAGSLDAWAQAGAARLARATDPNTLGWRLIEGLIGHDPIVAQHVSLRVTFDPDAVFSYRLVGHERVRITGPSVAETDIDLHSGETATALFEIMLKPGLKNNVALVESEWRHPNYGRKEGPIKKQVVRSQFGVAFASSPMSLQMAAVAALTAETLRGSIYAPANRSLLWVADVARQVAKPVQEEPTFRELTQFIDQAERVRTHRAKPPRPKSSSAPPN